MTAVFMSDVHLRDATSAKTDLVTSFLQEKASLHDDIYLLGDIFDVWPGTTDYLIQTFQPVLQIFKNLVKEGHRVHYLEGNHDFRLGAYFTEELGMRVYEREIVENWNGKRILMNHGDLGNPKEIGYRALRYLLRRDSLHFVLNKLPGELIFKLGARSSDLSREYNKKLPEVEKLIRETYRQTALRLFAKGYDVVLMGHTHLPDDVTTMVGDRSCRYINTGDWVRHFTYLEFDGREFYTRSHPVTHS